MLLLMPYNEASRRSPCFLQVLELHAYGGEKMGKEEKDWMRVCETWLSLGARCLLATPSQPHKLSSFQTSKNGRRVYERERESGSQQEVIFLPVLVDVTMGQGRYWYLMCRNHDVTIETAVPRTISHHKETSSPKYQ